VAQFAPESVAHIKPELVAQFARNIHTYRGLEEEIKCDEDACNQILNIPPGVIFDKRAMGIATGLLIMISDGIKEKKFTQDSHPYSFNRLIDNLARKVESSNDYVWGWVVGILALHFTNSSIAPPKLEFDNFYDTALAYKDILFNFRES